MLFLASLTAVACLGCAGGAPSRPAYWPREVVEVGRSRVLHGAAPLGELVSFEIRDVGGVVLFHRILDTRGRWVGHADATGRFSRRVPFQDAEEDLGVWSLPRGCALLFGVESEVQLIGAPAASPRGAAGPPR